MSERSKTPHGMTTEQVPSVRVLCAAPGRETCDQTAGEAGEEPLSIVAHKLLLIVVSLHDSARRQRLRDRHSVGILEITAHRQATGDP